MCNIPFRNTCYQIVFVEVCYLVLFQAGSNFIQVPAFQGIRIGGNAFPYLVFDIVGAQHHCSG